MNPETRKRIERELAEKVLRATIGLSQGDYRLRRTTDDTWWALFDPYDPEPWRRWSPMRNFHDAWYLFGRLVEKRSGQRTCLLSLTSAGTTGRQYARLDIGDMSGGEWGDTDAEALCLAMCDLLGIRTED